MMQTVQLICLLAALALSSLAGRGLSDGRNRIYAFSQAAALVSFSVALVLGGFHHALAPDAEKWEVAIITLVVPCILGIFGISAIRLILFGFGKIDIPSISMGNDHGS